VSYDVIVVGTRVAGSTTAMLLARGGLRVLALDQAGFPSDTVSSHQVQLPGIAALHRWCLLDRLRAAGTPPTRQVRFDSEGVAIEGSFTPHDGVDAMYSPRRTLLDKLLIDAAREAGAEVRERFRVTELVWRDGRVAGVRGPSGTELATLVIGADGKRSFTAEAVGARRYRQRPVRSFASYTYWAGLPVTAAEIYQRRSAAVAVFPTGDNLTMVYTAAPLGAFTTARANLEGHYLAILDRCGDLGERVRAATRAERLRTTPDQPNTFRVPHGPGWALVGDAGVVMDSISAQGITNALRDARLLADAVLAGLSGRRPLHTALADHHRERDQAIRPMYDFTLQLAAHAPGRRERAFLRRIRDRPGEAERFLAAFTGVTSPANYFSARTFLRLLRS
jgi:flavin-dependent dehydrogenase